MRNMDLKRFVFFVIKELSSVCFVSVVLVMIVVIRVTFITNLLNSCLVDDIESGFFLFPVFEIAN